MSMVTDSVGQVLAPADRQTARAIAAALRRAARQSRVPVMVISGGGGFRARKSDKLFWGGIVLSFVLIFALPTIIASIYYGLIASDQYVTEAKFALRTGESSFLDSLSGIPGLPSSQTSQDSQIIVNYITSRAMVEKLDSQIDLRRVYARSDVDWWARFAAEKPVEELEKYWRHRVDARLDQQTSILSLHVRAFTPEDSLQVATKIIENSEQLVNQFSERVRENALRDARSDLERAEARLVQATLAMRDERNTLGVISVEATAMMVSKVVGGLRLKLAELQQNLAVLARTSRPDSPPVRITTRQIDNLNAQIASYMSQMAQDGGNGDATLADRMERLSRKQTEIDVSLKLYASTVVSYESARIDAETKHGYLLAFMKPTLAQKALYPRRWLYWSLFVLPAFLLWAVVAGLGALVRDHMVA